MAFLSFRGLLELAIRQPLCAVLALTIGAAAQAQPGEQLDEYQVKAAFLYNFAKFVEWPTGAFKSADDPVAICVLGQNPFGSALEQIVSGKKVGERPFRIRQISDVKESPKCHMVFLTASENKRARPLLEEVKGLPVLTVGESNEFLSNGGAIAFNVRDTRVRFEIDGEAAARAKLKISSKLLSLAQNTKK